MSTITITADDLRTALDVLQLADHRLAEAEALFGALIGETQREQHRRPFFLANIGADVMDRALGELAEPLDKLRKIARASGVRVDP